MVLKNDVFNKGSSNLGYPPNLIRDTCYCRYVSICEKRGIVIDVELWCGGLTRKNFQLTIPNLRKTSGDIRLHIAVKSVNFEKFNFEKTALKLEYFLAFRKASSGIFAIPFYVQQLKFLLGEYRGIYIWCINWDTFIAYISVSNLNLIYKCIFVFVYRKKKVLCNLRGTTLVVWVFTITHSRFFKTAPVVLTQCTYLSLMWCFCSQ